MENNESIKKYGLLSLIFAVVYVVCLYKNTRGITYPIYMACALTLLGIARKRDGLSLFENKSGKKGINIFFVVSLMLLAISKCVFASSAIQILSGLAILLLLYCFIMQLYVDTTGWDILGWFGGIFLTAVLPIAYLTAPVVDFIEWIKSKGDEKKAQSKSNFMAVIIGIVIAIPILIVVLVLLTSADAVFNRAFEKFINAISLPDNIMDIFGVIVSLLIAFWCAYIIPNFLHKYGLRIKPSKQGVSNPIIGITITVIIGAVYVLFCLVQFLFLFTQSVDLPAGYTYASYAHEGFYQLLTVCIINLLMVSICSRIFAKNKILTFMLTAIGVCTYVMIASSAKRMLLYIGEYQLTFLRVFVLWFLVILSIWLAFLITGIYKRDFPVFRASMVVITVGYLLFAFSNPEYQIAKYDLTHRGDNVSGYDSVKNYIIYNLSTDAVPAVAEESDYLDDFQDHLRYEQPSEKYEGIRKFNFSYARAQKYFDQSK